nr:hypothetical protein [Bradyrhizobium sp. CCBAU 21360]
MKLRLNRSEISAVIRRPILGICLGHQCIGSRGTYGTCTSPMHARSSRITHDGRGSKTSPRRLDTSQLANNPCGSSMPTERSRITRKRFKRS